MRPPLGFHAARLVSLLPLLWVNPSAAQLDTGAAFRVVEACPSQPWFAARLSALGVPAARLEPRQAALEVVAARAGVLRGRLELRAVAASEPARSSAASWSRSIEGTSCEQIMEALAMSLSIHVESGAVAASDAGPANVDQPVPATSPIVSAAEPDAPRAAQTAKRAPRLTGSVGGQARSDLGSGVDLAARASLALEAVGEISSSLAFVFTIGGSATAKSLDAGGRLEHDWWTLGAEGCRWALPIKLGLRIEPCAALHAGRYAAEITTGTSQAEWFGSAELTARLRADQEGWTGWLQLGGHVPIAPLGVRVNGDEVDRQGPGLIVGAALGYSPVWL